MDLRSRAVMGSTTSTMGPACSACRRSTERTRFAPDPEVSTPPPRIQLTRALAKDLGPGAPPDDAHRTDNDSPRARTAPVDRLTLTPDQ